MVTITYPIFAEFLYPSEENHSFSGYPPTGVKGPIGEIHCSECGETFWHPDLDNNDFHDLQFRDMEIDCECKKTWVGFKEFENFEVELGYVQDDSAGIIEESKPVKVYKEYIIRNNALQIPVYGDPVGYLGDMTCGWCKQPFHFSKKSEKAGVIVCKNCRNRALLDMAYNYDDPNMPVLHELFPEKDIKEPANYTPEILERVTADQQCFLNEFFLTEEEEEVDTSHPMASFFKN